MEISTELLEKVGHVVGMPEYIHSYMYLRQLEVNGEGKEENEVFSRV